MHPLPSFLWHHFGDRWLTSQEQYIDQNLVAGDLLVQIDFSERQELTQKFSISEEEYSKRKLLMLVLKLAIRPT